MAEFQRRKVQEILRKKYNIMRYILESMMSQMAIGGDKKPVP